MPTFLPAPPAIVTETDALFLDFDGTLVDIAPTPDAITVPDDLVASLVHLRERLGGRLAIVSGRAIATLDEFGLGALSCSGSHGAEWRLASGDKGREPSPPGLDDARERFAALAEEIDGVLFEDKPLGAALHYRLAESDGAARRCHALAEELADNWCLHLQRGHEMIELRGRGADKGSAIVALMQRAPFAGSRPVFLGDDVTDEPGFVAVDEMGGHGILIGDPRESAARYRLSDPSAVKDYLTQVADSC